MAVRARQRTLADGVELAGRGLHGGHPVRMRLLPAPPDSGVVFARVDLRGRPEVAARSSSAVAAARRTVLASGRARVETPEHLLSACHGMGVDNLRVELDAPEPPALDGSALVYVEAMREVGLREQDAPPRPFRVLDEFTYARGETRLRLSPADALEARVSIEHPDPIIGFQQIEMVVDEETYAREIGPARTFGNETEARVLARAGLARGAGLANTVVVAAEGDRVLNGDGLRFAGGDEFVRHKMLDLVGDLALLGTPLLARVSAHRPGHASTARALRALRARGELWSVVHLETDPEANSLASNPLDGAAKVLGDRVDEDRTK